MKVFFIGTVVFSRELLKKTLEQQVEVVGVATKSKAGFNSDYADLTDVCEENNIPYKFVRDINAPHIIEWIKGLEPDVIFCFGWSQLIKDPLLNLTKHGVVGYHPAALPHNRGRHPIIWALALGLKTTGSTFFIMDSGADSGDIVSQTMVTIDEQDDAQQLYDKLLAVALVQVEEIVTNLRDPSFAPQPQDHSKANYWRKRGMQDGRIDFRMSADAIFNQVRALTRPYVGAHVDIQDESFKVWAVKPQQIEGVENIEPGHVIAVKENCITVKVGQGLEAVDLMDHEIGIGIEKGMYI